MYKLTFGFYNTTGLSHVPKLLLSDDTIINNAVVLDNFERNGYYGFLLNMPDQFQGFVLFLGSDDSEPAIFAINPQEVENPDVKTSTVRSSGQGTIDFPVVVNSSQNVPLSDVAVWMTSDQLGTTIVAGVLMTNAQGQVDFLLNPGPYWMWRRHSTYSFVNPQRIEV